MQRSVKKKKPTRLDWLLVELEKLLSLKLDTWVNIFSPGIVIKK